MNIKLKQIAFLVLSCAFNMPLIAIFPINYFRPWDINLRPPHWCGRPLQITGVYEGGVSSKGFNPNNDSVNVMQLWTPTQDAIAMLRGFPAGSPETEFLNDVLLDPSDDGIRGNFRVTGDFNLNANAFIGARYTIPQDLTFAAFLPLQSMRLKNVVFTDLTQDLTDEDTIIIDNLGNIQQVVQQFDPELNLTGWSKTGIGDLAIMAEWLRFFPQPKEYLNEVGLNIRLGLTFPTGFKTNVNEILFVPAGFDGSYGLFFGAGIILQWFHHLRGGVDFEFLTLFGDNRVRRIKIQQDQTDFLLLAKAKVHTEYGFTQRYNLFLQVYELYRGLSASAIYQFWKHGDDKIMLYNQEFSTLVANTAQHLQDWSIHQMIFKVEYDFQNDLADTAWLRPQLQFFYKFPFNGNRALLVTTVGAGLTLSF